MALAPQFCLAKNLHCRCTSTSHLLYYSYITTITEPKQTWPVSAQAQYGAIAMSVYSH
jgi:hypothetical protein